MRDKRDRSVLADKILIVDDEPDTLTLARMILEHEGYKVFVAINGKEALQKAEAERPDLILLDVVLPDKSGFEICGTLKAQSKTKSIPVVMFTVLGREIDKQMSKDAGADGHFTKTFTSKSLVAEVKKTLEKKRM